jgi:hypothetical protein
MSKPPSPVTPYFQLRGNHWFCIVTGCKNVQGFKANGGSTSSRKNHLQFVHRALYDTLFPSAVAATVCDGVSLASSRGSKRHASIISDASDPICDSAAAPSEDSAAPIERDPAAKRRKSPFFQACLKSNNDAFVAQTARLFAMHGIAFAIADSPFLADFVAAARSSTRAVPKRQLVADAVGTLANSMRNNVVQRLLD